MRKLGDWLDERLGHRALVRSWLDHPVPGGARWAYVFGSVLVFLLGLQALTGILMATVYAPSTQAAWASVVYLERSVSLGWLMRRLHAGGASAMVIVCVLHLLQTTLWGAYRRPREVNWWVGLLLMACLLGFALTGYLLPWDQKGFWATQVATNLAAVVPLVGERLRELLLGGPEYGALTLTRFYAAHTLLLPALTVILVVIHVALMRKHGVTPSWRLDEEAAKKAAEPFRDRQLIWDLLAMTATLAALFGWAFLQHRSGVVPVDAPADPAASYEARPEWYFLPLFQLLKYFPGRWEPVGAIGVPLVAAVLLMGLPLFDKGPSRSPARRKRFVGVVLVLLGGAAALGVLAVRADARDPAYAKARKRADAEAARAFALAADGVPVAGGTAVYDNDPLVRGRRVFGERCAGCHVLDGQGERKGPDLDGWSSRTWISAFLHEPTADRFYGTTKIRGMKPIHADAPDEAAMVEWIFSQGGGTFNVELAQKGRALIESMSCNDCHELDGVTVGDGVPNLGNRASLGWTVDFLREPDKVFGRKNDMPSFAKLDAAELDALAALMAAERTK